MSGNENIRVGSKLIEGGRVYKIFKIEEEIIYYKPYFSKKVIYTEKFEREFKKADTSMICSIPKHNLSSTLIREPLSKKDIQIFLKGLAIEPENYEIDNNEAKNILNLNDLKETMKLLCRYWKEKNKTETNFSESKKRVLVAAAERICEEIACVFEISLEKAENKLTAALTP